MPILINENEINIFNNFFYKNWNEIYVDELIEFILPLENIEILQNINKYKNNLININVVELFKEYTNKNLALVLIEDSKSENKTVYIKSIIQEKNLSKSLKIKVINSKLDKIYEQIIIETKKELIDLIKNQKFNRY